jgi:hypothetical protein
MLDEELVRTLNSKESENDLEVLKKFEVLKKLLSVEPFATGSR